MPRSRYKFCKSLFHLFYHEGQGQGLVQGRGKSLGLDVGQVQSHGQGQGRIKGQDHGQGQRQVHFYN